MNHAAVPAEFYEDYARRNYLDFLELSLLDILYQNQGGPMTWMALQSALDCPRHRMRHTAATLNQQDLLLYNEDLVWLTSSAPYMISEVLEDLHSEFDQYNRKQTEDLELNLLA